MSYNEFKKVKIKILQLQQELNDIEKRIAILKEAGKILASSRTLQELGHIQATARVHDNV